MDPVTTTAVATAAAENFSVFSLFSQASLFVKFVMLLLLGMSVVTWAVLISKFRIFRTLRGRADRFEEAFWGDHGLEELYKNTHPEDTDHPMAKVFVVGLREWEHARESGTPAGILHVSAIDRVRQMMTVSMNRELERIEQMLPVLATVGSTAPFIGLLGTVWGIMNSFQSIGAMKNTSLAVVAPGIAEALLATALGLFAAIPAVIAYNKLSVELGRYAARMEAFVTEFVALLDRQQDETQASARKNSRKRRATDKKDDDLLTPLKEAS